MKPKHSAFDGDNKTVHNENPPAYFTITHTYSQCFWFSLAETMGVSEEEGYGNNWHS